MYASCILFLTVAGLSYAQKCGEWFTSNPSRCGNAMFRNWCPVASANVCGDESPRRSNNGGSGEKRNNRNGSGGRSAERNPSQNDQKDCAAWFQNNPERCGKKMFVSWCPNGAAKMCDEGTVRKVKGSNERGSPKPKEKVKNQKRTSKEKRTKSPERKTTKGPSRERSTKRPERTTPKPEKSKNRNNEKSGSKGNKSKDDVYLDCAKEHDVPKSCHKYAKYKKFDVKEIGCNNPECIDSFGPMMYCMSNGQDNSRCCRDSEVDSACKKFCNGKDTVRINEMFGSVASAVKYLPCIQKADDIRKCHENGHSGKDQPKRSFKKEKLSDQMRALLKNQCE